MEGGNSRTRIGFQDEVPVPHEFSKYLIQNSCHSRTHWLQCVGASVDGSRRYSIQNGKSSHFIEDAHLIALQSSKQDPSLDGEKAKKED